MFTFTISERFSRYQLLINLVYFLALQNIHLHI